jgi:DNA replication protein DnaD
MSLAKFSSDYLIESFTLVDNLFINEYLPAASENQLKVYLYGLYLCTVQERENTLEAMSAALNIPIDEIISVFRDFEDSGLVQIVSTEPFGIKYLSFKRAQQPAKKYKSEKWNDFNAQLQQLFPERMLYPHEYNEYYSFIDSYKIEKDAVLMIVQYCINLKGASVSYPYILTVARNWVSDGVKTAADVEKRLTEYETQSENMREVLSALRRKGGAELEEKQMLDKWLRSWGYDMAAVLAAAKSLKGSKSFVALDKRLDEFYRNGVFSEAEIKDFVKRREYLYGLAVSVVNKLGLFYQSLDQVIEVYINAWLSKGFEDKAVILAAEHCFVSGIRTLEGMDKLLDKFYKLGLLSAESIREYFGAQLEQDKRIKEIIQKSGRVRAVTSSDREFYRTWSAVWGFDDEIIYYAASLAEGKIYPNTYINQLLSSWKSEGVATLEQAKTKAPQLSTAPAGKKIKQNYIKHNYSEEQLKSILSDIDNFDDIEI